MANHTVELFACALDMPPQALLDLLKAAGVVKESIKDRVSEADKAQLREHLISTRSSAGVVSPRKLTRLSATESPKQPQGFTPLRTQAQFEFDTPADTDIN